MTSSAFARPSSSARSGPVAAGRALASAADFALEARFPGAAHGTRFVERIPLAATLLPLLLLAPAVASCGAVATDPPLRAHALSLAAESACRASAASLCARIEACSPPELAYFFGTRGACDDIISAACRARYEGPGAAGAPAACDASRLRCELVKDVERVIVSGARLYDLCPVAPGRFADGERCLGRGDCASGRCGSCGVCEPRLPDGARCDRDTACAEGSLCLWGICRRGALVGEACAAASDCVGGTLATRCEAGACAWNAQGGASCKGGSGCDLGGGLVCDCGGSTCDANKEYTCRPVTFVGDGAPCDGDVPHFTRASSPTCDGASACGSDRVCRRARALGEPCGPAATERCARALVCADGRCAVERKRRAVEGACVDRD
jgi:hypothetical protein